MKILLLAAVVCCGQLAQAQEKLIKDLDNDTVNDTAYLDRKRAVVVCKLSSQGFKTMESRPIEILNDQSDVTATKNGFEFSNHWMRAGYQNQFRYNPKAKKMQLIGMMRYEFGPANNNGSGESSVNLLTNDYIGKWNYFDDNKERLISMPPIKTKMVFPITWLENFGEQTYFDYAEKCAALFVKQKNLLLKKNH